MPEAAIYDDRACDLGEGALWHPGRATLYWFDITAGLLLWRDAAGTPGTHAFGRMASAAAVIDSRHLLVATETDLVRLDLDSGRTVRLCPLEEDRPATRSNDGRADPRSGFWIGTMGKGGESGQGAIWRWHGGTLRRLHAGLTVPNAICFSPDGRTAYFADTRARRVWRQALSPADGWPAGAPELFLDLSAGAAADGLEHKPDGAVTDAEGCLWIAQWGSGRVARYSPSGTFLGAVPVPAAQASCPAFGGADFGTLFVTTARRGLDAAQAAAQPLAGMTFRIPGCGRGRAEPPVLAASGPGATPDGGVAER